MAGGNRWAGVAACGIGVLFLASGGGCTLDLAAQIIPSDNGNGSGSGTPDRDNVQVVFRNLTENEAVEVEFYATEEPLEVVPDDLFDPANDYLVVRNIGVGGRGVIAPGETDSIAVDCGAGLILGTLGGLFVDNESGDELGTGTRRWIQEDAQFSCGATIVLEYTTEGDTYRTDLLLGVDGS